MIQQVQMNQHQLRALACSIAELLSTLDQECCAGRLPMEITSAPLENLHRSGTRDYQLSSRRLIATTQAPQRDRCFYKERDYP